MRYINHFQLFSSALYLLLKERVTEKDIRDAEIKLTKFTDEYEILYGKHNVTMNIHLLRHIANSVRHLGPLWAQSAFSFESNNGIIVKANNATKDILHNLSWKYTVKSSVQEDLKPKDQHVHLGCKTTLRIDSHDISQLIENELEIYSKILTIYKDISICGTKFTSLHSKIISTADYFVKLVTGKMGTVNFFLKKDVNVYAIIKIFDVKDSVDHLIEVQATNMIEIYNVKMITKKMMFMKIGSYEIVSEIANRYEKT